MILGIDILTELGLNPKNSKHVIKADCGPFKGTTSPMIYLGAYVFKDLNIGEIKPEELFTDDYVEEVYESEHLRTTNKRLRVILDAKYKKADLHKVMETQRQNLTMKKHNGLLKLLQKF